MSSSLFASAAAGENVLVSETGVEHLQFVVRTGPSVFPVGGSASKKGDELPSGPGPYNLLNAALALARPQPYRFTPRGRATRSPVFR
jgi:hypothetical protein